MLLLLPSFIHLTFRMYGFVLLSWGGVGMLFFPRRRHQIMITHCFISMTFFQGLWPHIAEATLAAFHPYGKQLVSWCDQAWYSPSSSSCTCRTLFCYRKQSYCKQFLYLSLFSPQCWECYVVQCQTKCIFPLSWPSSSELLYALEIWAAFSCGVW